MKKSTVSMVVLTRDRPTLLRDCLQSIERQRTKPLEVIIVDDSRDEKKTFQVIREFKKLPVKVLHSPLKSIASARDTGARFARGDIVLYLDDDLKAPPTYVRQVVSRFIRDPQLAAVIGKIINRYPQNVYASVQYAYYLKGLGERFTEQEQPQELTEGRMLDCEVMGIRRTIIQTYGFVTDRPPRYRNDDVELGLRLIEEDKKILYDPNITVVSSPRTSLLSLLTVAFWNGYSDAHTENIYQINLRKNQKPTLSWILSEARNNRRVFSKIWFMTMLLLFPMSARLGKLTSIVQNT